MALAFEHYTIRSLTTGDLMSYFALVERNRERLADFFTGTVARTRSLEETDQFLLEILERVTARTYFPYVIVDNHNGTFAGFLDIKNIDWTIPKGELGCYIDKDVAGKGFGKKALGLFCTYCFQTFGFQKLFLRTHPGNESAKRLAECCGFEKEGLIRCDYKTTAGALVDLLYYGRLKGELSSSVT